MFFYNEPSIGVGLSDITVFYSNTASDDPQHELDFTLLNNQDMSQDDMKRRNVSIVITSDASEDYSFFAIRFDFSSVKVNTLRLYEIELLNEGNNYCCSHTQSVCVCVCRHSDLCFFLF